MTYNYLLQHNNHTLKLWVAGEEMPKYEFLYYKGNPEAELFYNSKLKVWLTKAKQYDFADEENEKRFVELSQYNYLNNLGMLHDSWETDLSKGILIRAENVEIRKRGICCWTNKNYPYHGPHCDYCADYKEDFFAHFVQPSVPVLAVVEEETHYTKADVLRIIKLWSSHLFNSDVDKINPQSPEQFMKSNKL